MKTKNIIFFVVILFSTSANACSLFDFWDCDTFDYADENSSQLNIKQDEWKSVKIEKPVEVNILQAKVAIYWKKELNSKIKWNCDDDNSSIWNDRINIWHTECLLFLPLQSTSITVTQGEAVLVQPKSNVSVKVMQGKLRIAENEEKYKYSIDGKDKYHQFISNKDASITIKINSHKGGSVEKYIYND